ncbi:MAG: hypothetical protein JWM27_2046 [Gemmatimonadetes bacterium]|nr:hypothetical protein [Gemmatimonadota bacterium]
MSSNDLTTAIEAEIRGNVSGQVAVGTHILQIGSVHGGVVNVAVPAERVRPRPRAAPVFLRPRPFPRLVGRAREVESAAAALRSARPVELSGPQGAGKTALLRHLVHDAAVGSFPGGVVFLPALRQPAGDLLQLLFDALFESDAPIKPTYPELCHLLLSWQALVVLDDVDLAREEMEHVLNAAPGCTFLWAAPVRRAWGEVRALALAGLEPDAARTLLEGELERPLSLDEVAALPALCEATGGFPLPLLQAAARVRDDDVPLAEGATGRRAGALADGGRAEQGPAPEAGSGAAEPSLRQRELALLLAAVGGALLLPRHAAALTGIPDAEPELEALERRGLAQRQGERYRLRERAGAPAEEEAAWRARALAYFTAWVEQCWSEPAEIVAEKDVLMSLLGGAVDAEAWPDVLRLGRRVEGALAMAGHWDAWRRVVEWLRRAAEAGDDRRGAAWALHQLGSMDLCLGDRAAAQAALESALDLREALGERAGARITRHNLDLLLAPPPPDERGGREPRRLRRPGRRSVAAVGAVAAVGVMTLLSVAGRVNRASPPRVDFDPAIVDFGGQPVGGSSSARVLRLTNPGTAGLRIGGVSAAGSDFRIGTDGCSGRAELRPGHPCSVNLLFAPSSAGPRQGRVAVTDATGRTLSEVVLAGVGTAPPPVPPAHPSVARNAAPMPARVRVDLAVVDFGRQPLRAPAVHRTVRLSNAGGRPVRVARVRLEGSSADFRLYGGDCTGAVVPPGGACSVVVGFAPVVLGTTAATVVVEHDASGGPARVALRGAGRAPQEAPAPRPPAASAVLTPGRLEFGPGATGAPRVREAALVNRGSVPLAVRALTVSQPGAEFHARSTCLGSTVAPGGTCTIQVAYTPSGPGPSAAELLVETNDPQGPARLSLTAAQRAEPVPPPGERSDGQLRVPGTGRRHPGTVRKLLGAAAIVAAVAAVAIVQPGGGGASQPPQVGPSGAAPPRTIRRAGPAPPTPNHTAPGNPTAADPEGHCGSLGLAWARVEVPGTPVTYVVRYAVGRTGGVPAQQTRQTGETTIALPGLASGEDLRWNVSARDAAGQESPPSPWLYLSCPVPK